jgi:hypothetical protein
VPQGSQPSSGWRTTTPGFPPAPCREGVSRQIGDLYWSIEVLRRESPRERQRKRSSLWLN